MEPSEAELREIAKELHSAKSKTQGLMRSESPNIANMALDDAESGRDHCQGAEENLQAAAEAW